MTEFSPFAEVAQETTIKGASGSIIIASDTDRIMLSGDIEIQPNYEGLSAAVRLRDMLISTIEKIESGYRSGNSPTEDLPIIEKDNPFT